MSLEMTMVTVEIVEIYETRSYHLANAYLEHGYVLLGVEGVHYKNPNKEPRLATPGFIRGTAFVVGRTKRVDRLDEKVAKDKAWGPRKAEASDD